jgi:23S rRNA pseudouridine1911/1915/1917 synthase
MIKFTASENMTLIEGLALLYPDSSKTTLRSWIKEGRVFVDGRPCKLTAQLLLKGQKIELGEKQMYAEGDLRILYEDRHVVVVDKPVGLLSVATAFEKGETAQAFLKNWFRKKSPTTKVFAVHRLDQDTSGVMMFALTEKARDALKKNFEAHDIERVYVALVEGAIPTLKGKGDTWKSYQKEDSNYHVHNVDESSGGKLAITHYLVKEVTKRNTLLELRLETGRKNQIRAHCDNAGYPVVGDKKYGARTNPLKRLGLHAYLLGFEHPITQKKMVFISPVPEAFYKVLN